MKNTGQDAALTPCVEVGLINIHIVFLISQEVSRT